MVLMLVNESLSKVKEAESKCSFMKPRKSKSISNGLNIHQLMKQKSKYSKKNSLDHILSFNDDNVSVNLNNTLKRFKHILDSNS
jgi:hypothetical protein